MNIFEKRIKKADEMKSEGGSLDEIMEMLRGEGASIIDSVKIIRSLEGVSLGRAKEIVDQSNAWSDQIEHNQSIRNIAVGALRGEDDCNFS